MIRGKPRLTTKRSFTVRGLGQPFQPVSPIHRIGYFISWEQGIHITEGESAAISHQATRRQTVSVLRSVPPTKVSHLLPATPETKVKIFARSQSFGELIDAPLELSILASELTPHGGVDDPSG